MPKRKVLQSTLVSFTLLAVLLLSACLPAKPNNTATPIPEGAYSVDPLFREFYELLGGEKIMGPAISPMFAYANRKYQYVQAGCLEYNPSASASQRYHLSALGLDMNISEPQVESPNQDDVLYVDGHIVYSGFVPLYRKLGGARFVGKPLTEVHYNPEKSRFEQYFENLGFYWVETDPPEMVSLLAYGAWKCDTHCRYAAATNATVDLPSLKPAPGDQIFREAVARLGVELTGFALTEPYPTDDQMVEQIYSNVVLFADPANLTQVSLRPLPEKVGILPEPPGAPSNVKGMVFWAISGDQGFNVPQPFLNFVMKHGGIEVSGPPIGNLSMTEDKIFRQCFQNLCLDYQLNSTLPESLRIHPAPLGHIYRNMHYQPPEESNFPDTQSVRTMILQVWEKYQFLGKNQAEEIGASVFDGNTPVKNIEPILVVTLPDGTQASYYFPPTGADGKTVKQIDPIDAPNGTIVPYQVCISSITKELFCVKDSFVIWYNQ